MDIWRKWWLWVIIGMIFVSVVISLIFILINKCISRAGKHRITQLQRGANFAVSNKYQETTLKAAVPPLPPRSQFLTAEAQSYENLAEVPDYEQSVPDYEQSVPDYEQSVPDYEQSVLDYEQSVPDYEQSLDDYVKVEDEDEETLPPPPPPYVDPDPEADNASSEDYDDIGGEDENQDEEDYDDVG